MTTAYYGTRSRYDNGVFLSRTLSNGIEVFFQQPQLITNDEGIVIAFLPRVGSCIENPNEHGIAHFFEHIPFDVKRLGALHRGGGDWNGSTSILQTNFRVTAPKESFRQAVQAIKLLVAEPLFEERIVRRECGVISREYAMKLADKEYIMAAQKACTFFDENHPLGHYPIGDLSVIEAMSGWQLEQFFGRYYHAGNIKLVCGGAFSELGEERVLATLEKALGDIDSGDSAVLELSLPLQRASFSLADASFPREQLALHYLSDEQLTPAEYDALDFLAALLNGMHSPLLRELRTKRGWVYESGLCGVEWNHFGWEFHMDCWTKPQHFEKVQKIFRKVLEGLTPKYICQEQNLRQLERKTSFSNAVSVCRRVPNIITSVGCKYSRHAWEEIEDELSLERILAWRDRLLSMEPIVVELRQA